MSMLTEIITNWRMKLALALVQKMNPVARLAITGGPAGGEQPQAYDMSSHLAAYMVNAYVFACIKAIARDVSATPLLVQQRKTIDGEKRWVTMEQGPLYDLFNRPNNDETWEDLSERWITGLVAAGGSPLIYDGTDKELYYVRPDWVKIKVDDAGRHSGYVIAHKGLTVNSEVDEIIYAKLANPSGDYYGLPPSEVVKQAIMTDVNLDSYLNRFFKNNTILGLVLTSQGAMTPDQKKAALKELNKLHAGVDNSFKNLILEKGSSINRLSQSIRELVPKEVDDRVMRKVLAAYGVPPVKIGVLDGASYSNANKQDEIYERGTVDPIRRKIEGTLNLQFVRVQYGPDYRVHYDRSEILGLQEDQNEKSKRIRGEWKDGLLRLNEARESLGRDPVDEDENGLEFYRPPVGITFQPPDGDEGNGDGNSSKFFISDFRGLKDVETEQWKIHDKKLVKKEKVIAGSVSAFFDDQLERLLDKIDTITGKGYMRTMLGFHLLTKDDENFPEDMPERLFDMKAENKLLLSQMGSKIREIVTQGGNDGLDELDINMIFSISSPDVVNAIGAMENRITFVNRATWESYVRPMLREAYDAGETVGDIKTRLQDMYSHWTDKKLENYRAMRIARTETNTMVETGKQFAWQQSGVVVAKQWVATHDNDARTSHIDAEAAGPIGLKERFMVGDSMMLHPGDPSGGPEETINCRCDMQGILET